MAPILSAMQYFALKKIVPTRSQLLFYLVTSVFAQSLSGFDQYGICDNLRRSLYAVEHVLTYSAAVMQVPYNQHLEQRSVRVCLSLAFEGIRFSQACRKIKKKQRRNMVRFGRLSNAPSPTLCKRSCRNCNRRSWSKFYKHSLLREADAAPAAEGSGDLVHAVSSIHAGSTQKEILRALLDASCDYCARTALFVVKAGAASGWQSRNFGNEEAVKDLLSI